eukprot:6917960-Karenia_brevis.AAC.1
MTEQWINTTARKQSAMQWIKTLHYLEQSQNLELSHDQQTSNQFVDAETSTESRAVAAKSDK